MQYIKEFKKFIKEQCVDFGDEETIEHDINKMLYESLGSSPEVIVNSKILCDRLSKKLKKLVWKPTNDFNADECVELHYKTTIDGYSYAIDCIIYSYDDNFDDNYIDVFDSDPLGISPDMDSKLCFKLSGNIPCVRRRLPSSIIDVIEHEMMHAYKYQKVIHNEVDLRVFNAQHKQYDSIQKLYNSNISQRGKELCDVIYQTYPDEIASYTQSFDAELRKCKKIDDVDSVMKKSQLYLRNTNLKKVISDMGDDYESDRGVAIVLSYLNISKDKLKKKLEKIYNDINHRMYSLVLRRKDILSELYKNAGKTSYEQYKIKMESK